MFEVKLKQQRAGFTSSDGIVVPAQVDELQLSIDVDGVGEDDTSDSDLVLCAYSKEGVGDEAEEECVVVRMDLDEAEQFLESLRGMVALLRRVRTGQE